MNKHIIVTVHGIRTFGQWQQRLANLISEKSPNSHVFNYTYGYFSVLAFLIPPLRWLVTRKFRKSLEHIFQENPSASVDLVGHSFGTHLIGWSINSLSKNESVKFNTIILSGSVLKPTFDWAKFISLKVVDRVINDCGINDSVLVANQLFVLFTGMAGRLGFQGMLGRGLVNRYFIGGHSLYFEKEGNPTDAFMDEYWLPILVDKIPAQPVDQRKVLTWKGGLATTIIQNAEIVKFLIYTAIIVMPLVNYYRLYHEADRQRVLANSLRIEAEQKSRDLAYEVISLINEVLYIPYDRAGLSNEGVTLLNFASDKLINSGIQLPIRISGHVGQFKVIDIDEEPHLSSNLLNILLPNKTRNSYSREYSMALGERYARTFKDILISKGYPAALIEVVSYGTEQPKFPYPIESIDEWNSIALKNNRCEIVL